MENWKYEYEGYNIEVKNSMTKCELYINDELVDEHKGIDFGANLTGKLDNGEQLLVVLHAGTLSAHCDVYIVKEKLEPLPTEE